MSGKKRTKKYRGKDAKTHITTTRVSVPDRNPISQYIHDHKRALVARGIAIAVAVLIFLFLRVVL